MPSTWTTPPGAEEEMACGVINRFVSIPEQTYEGFLSMFTSLPPERQDCKVQSDHTPRPTSSDLEIPQGAEDEPEQLTIGEGVTVGWCHSLLSSGRVQVDNFIGFSDVDTDSDDEAPDASVLLFPGEADTAFAGGNKPVIRNTCLETRASSRLRSTTDEHLGDEIQPFSLDQSFDYDCVVLTSKLSEAEMTFLKARGPQVVEEKESAEQTLP
ncbi:intraflagellar transport-associated protein isoform X2 [Mixophyes fleayi]